MPMDADTTQSRPPSVIGTASAAWSRSQTWRTSTTPSPSVRQQQHELIPALARQRVDVAQRFGQTPRHLDQQLVADVVPERVIDPLEVVQVDEDHGEPTLLPARLGQFLAESVVQQAAVRQASEAVVRGQVADAFQVGAPLAHVLDGGDHPAAAGPPHRARPPAHAPAPSGNRHRHGASGTRSPGPLHRGRATSTPARHRPWPHRPDAPVRPAPPAPWPRPPARATAASRRNSRPRRSGRASPTRRDPHFQGRRPSAAPAPPASGAASGSRAAH